MSKLFKPKIKTPEIPEMTQAAPIAAASQETPTREIGGDSEDDLQKRRRKGRNKLRIDRSGPGLNTPKGK